MLSPRRLGVRRRRTRPELPAPGVRIPGEEEKGYSSVPVRTRIDMIGSYRAEKMNEALKITSSFTKAAEDP